MKAPRTLILCGKETHDGKSHEALRNIVWFETRHERDAFTTRLLFDGVKKFQARADGRTLYAAETLTYID